MTTGVRLVTLVLEVADLDRSTRLYQEAFGLDLHRSDHGRGDGAPDRWIEGAHASLSWTDGAPLHLALYAAKGPVVSTGVQVGLSVDDLPAAHAVAVAAGAEVVHEPRAEPWGSTARYRDLDGNVVSLTQPR